MRSGSLSKSSNEKTSPKKSQSSKATSVKMTATHSVFSLWRSQNKNANQSIQNVQKWKRITLMYKKPRQESGLRDNSYARYSGKRFTPIYKALYGDAMLVTLWGAQIWPPETNRNICFWVFLLMHEFIAWGTHKD